MPKLLSCSNIGVESIVSPIALVTGEHKGFAACGVASNPPQLPNLSLSCKNSSYKYYKFKIRVAIINSVLNQYFGFHLQVMVHLFIWKNPLHVWIDIKFYG